MRHSQVTPEKANPKSLLNHPWAKRASHTMGKGVHGCLTSLVIPLVSKYHQYSC